MQTIRVFPSVAIIALLLAGCSSSNSASPNSTANGTQVSLSMTDDPPAGVTVLFFQISLTGATLAPASGSGTVSLLSNNSPITVDVTQLQAISAFLSSANVSPGTYNSLSLTFANPQLVIFNASDQAIASTCPINSTCQLMPQMDGSSTVMISSAPFPVMVAQNTSVGFLLDFHLDQVIQSDLSVNLGVANGVTVDQLPISPPVPFGFVQGTVQNVNSGQNQFTLQTRDGGMLTIDVNGNTAFTNFPSSVCMTGAFSCLASGQMVKVQVAGVQSDGSLQAGTVSFVGSSSQMVVEGTIIGLSNSTGATVMKLLVHFSPDSSLLPFGGLASVTLSPTSAFAVDSGNFNIPAGLSFAGTGDLVVGQDVQVDVGTGSVSNSPPGPFTPASVSFTTDSVELEPSPATGSITTINSSQSSFTLTIFPFFAVPFTPVNITPAPITVETTSQTSYQGLNPDSFSGLSTNGLVSVQGFLFATPTGPTPSTIAAQTVIGRIQGFF